MSYCGPRGIPRTRFLGGPDVWTQHDRDLALAWMIRERHRCGSCGFHPDDDPNGYRATEHQCPGCAKLETTKKARRQRRKGDDVELPGVYWALSPVPAEAPDEDPAEDPARVDEPADDEETSDAPRPR
jgi:hypothetical protein